MLLEPITVVIEDDGGLAIETILALVGSVLVAVITAVGVILAANRNSKALIDAETTRHQHDLEASEVKWLRDQKADAYFRLIDAMSRSLGAAYQVVWFARPKKGAEAYEPVNRDGVNQQIALWNAASSDVEIAAAAVRAVGQGSIARDGSKVSVLSRKMLDRGLSDAEKFPGMTWASGRPHRQALARRAQRKFRRVVRAIREDLGADHLLPSPVSARDPRAETGEGGQGSTDAGES